MSKKTSDFDLWNEKKKKLNKSQKKHPYFREGEIRWATMGKNLKTEIVGKGNNFSRPVLVFKKLYGHSGLVIPLTSQKQIGSYYYELDSTASVQSYAILSQIKYMDGARLREKIGYVTPSEFERTQNAFFEFIKK